MVVLGVDDQEELEHWESILSHERIRHEVFVEPDLGDQKTSLAVSPASNPRLFRKLRLL
jgi:hypothetical protein